MARRDPGLVDLDDTSSAPGLTADEAHAQAYESGRRYAREQLRAAGGDPLRARRQRLEDPDLDEYHEAGFADVLGETTPPPRDREPSRRRQERRAPRRSGRGTVLHDQARASRAGAWVEEGSGFLVGMLLWALVLAYFRGGPAEVKGWLAAKFINRPYHGPTATPLTPAPPSPPRLTAAHPGAGGLIPAVPYLGAFSTELGGAGPAYAAGPG